MKRLVFEDVSKKGKEHYKKRGTKKRPDLLSQIGSHLKIHDVSRLLSRRTQTFVSKGFVRVQIREVQQMSCYNIPKKVSLLRSQIVSLECYSPD